MHTHTQVVENGPFITFFPCKEIMNIKKKNSRRSKGDHKFYFFFLLMDLMVFTFCSDELVINLEIGIVTK
jgi:hypothetical protein